MLMYKKWILQRDYTHGWKLNSRNEEKSTKMKWSRDALDML